MTTNFINLTPHVLNVICNDGTVIDIPTSGIVARCAQDNEVVDTINGISVTKQTFGSVTGLPESQRGTYYVVSRLVAAACPERKDLFIPGPLVRNDKGQPIGCKGLSVL